MRLQPGATLAHYEVLGTLGAGGMGEVYRARDRRLRREVALKVLPEAFAEDPARLARLEREALSLAALNHPHIGAIHGFEAADDVHFLVLELVPGSTLAERLARGRLTVAQVVDLARQVAEALEEAHGRGIVHRDLKPSNIKLTPEGRVKVLDFGVAKALAETEDGPSPGTASTLTAPGTGTGAIVGTPAYMAPEQARGEEVDRRTDIWAFGCVLYEALTGKPAFSGASTAETVAAVLTAEPDWDALPPDAPRSLRSLLRRCLRKDKQRRLRDIADARLELEDLLAEPEGIGGRGRPAVLRPGTRPFAVLVIGAVLALASAGTLLLLRARAPGPAPQDRSLRLHIGFPKGAPIWFNTTQPAMTLSPDGKLLIYVGDTKPVRRLYKRPLDRLEIEPIAGTEDAYFAFFSPDGEWLGFAAGGKLKKVSLRGGPPVTLCDAPDLRGASWGEDGTIVFASTGRSGLSRVSADGGEPRLLTWPDRSEENHCWPRYLPGGRAVLFTVRAESQQQEESRIAVLSFDSGAQRVLVKGGTGGLYAPTGHLLYGLEGALLAAPFDLGRLAVTGRAVTVLPDVLLRSWGSGALPVDLSPAGPLVYTSGSYAEGPMALVWVDRQGRVVGEATQVRQVYDDVMLSPDGKRLVVRVGDSRAFDLWTLDLGRDVWTRLTFDGRSGGGVWSPDGRRLAFGSWRGRRLGTFVMPADGHGPARQLTAGDPWDYPTSWSVDGNALALCIHEPTLQDIGILPLDGGRSRALVETPFAECQATFSPDGRWIAYTSGESGQPEVHVRLAGGGGEKRWVISRGGGTLPRWSPIGGELFYRSGDRLMAVTVARGGAFTPGLPQELFAWRWPHFRVAGGALYDVSPDGQRFLMIQPNEEAEPEPPRVVFIPSWLDELERLVPSGEG